MLASSPVVKFVDTHGVTALWVFLLAGLLVALVVELRGRPRR